MSSSPHRNSSKPPSIASFAGAPDLENEIEWSDQSVDILERNRQSDRGKEKIEKEEEPFRRRRTAQAGREAIGSGCRKDIEREKKKRKVFFTTMFPMRYFDLRIFKLTGMRAQINEIAFSTNILL
ncbi:unnamed protein product [Brassica oleracea var. botrytis]